MYLAQPFGSIVHDMFDFIMICLYKNTSKHDIGDQLNLFTNIDLTF